MALQLDGRMLPLDGDDLILGRSAERADLVIPDSSVSREHLRLLTVGSTVTLLDLGSRNGVLVNGRRVNIPSYGVRPDDIVSLKPGSPAETIVRDATDLTAAVSPWLQADHDGLTGKMLKWPERAEIDTPVQESLIVELYSK